MKQRTIQCWDGDGVIPPEELKRRREQKRDMEAKRARAEKERADARAARAMVRMALRQKKAYERARKASWAWVIHCARFNSVEKDGVHHMTVFAPHDLGPDPEIKLKASSGTIDETTMKILIQAGAMKTLITHQFWKSVSFQYGFDPHKPMAIPVRWKVIKPQFIKVVQRKTAVGDASIFDIAFTCKRIENEKVDLPKSVYMKLDEGNEFEDRY